MTPQLTLADLARLPHPGMVAPSRIEFAPDGAGLTYLFSAEGSLVRSLWYHDLQSGERHVLAAAAADAPTEEALSEEEQLRRQRTRTVELGVTEYAWASDADEPTLIVPIADGQVMAARDRPPFGQLRPIPELEGASRTALSPDGRRVAFVRDGDVWVVPIEGGAARRLTVDAEPGLFNGLPDYVAAEELDRFDGMWWSTDSQHLAIARVDERGVPEHAIARLASVAGGFEAHRYPFAGGPNAHVRLRIVPTEGEEPRLVPLPMADDDYLARVIPHPGGGWLVAVLPRDQRSLRWLAVEPSGDCRELWVETADPWINLDDDTRMLADGRILRTTERTGFRHLELRDPDGRQGPQLTGGEWVVTGVAAVDETREEVWLVGTLDGVTERHLYRVSLLATTPIHEPERISHEAGWHAAVVRRDGMRWVDSWSSLESAPRAVLRDREGAALAQIHVPATSGERLGLTPPELLELPAADGATSLHAMLYRPNAREAARSGVRPTADRPKGPHRRPPCVVWVYGGPHSEYVCNAWESTVHPLRQYLAQHGAAVLVVDNRGTAYRGLAFEAEVNHRFGTVEIADQAAAVTQLAHKGEIDPGRVAITGGSYGGYLTLLAMARHPDLFRVGVAFAPVGDWKGYDTAYTERYLGLPQENASTYRDASAVTYAGQIRGDLLLIHGTQDENVHLTHSVAILAALQAAGRNIELLLIPDQRHRLRGEAAIRLSERRTAEHLLAGLGLEVPGELQEPSGDEVRSEPAVGTATAASV
jgi:dipeptidyl-peptidase 4